MHESVVVTVAGQPFDGWEKISVTGSVKEACRAMHLEFPDSLGSPRWPSIFSGQPQASVTAGGELIFTGYVDLRAPRIGPRFLVTIGARSKAQDAVDCTVDHTKPDYVQRNVHDVAQDQDRFGIGFACDFQPDGFDRWRPNPGDPLFHALRPLCEDEDATMAGQPDGSVKITRAGASAEPQAGTIVEGVNIWEGGAVFDDCGQHSKIRAHGQSYRDTGAQATQMVGEADNSNVARLRPLDLHHDRHTSRDRLKRLAKRRRDKEQGEGIRAEFRMRGWRDSGGMLWTPGKKVWVQSASLDLSQYMLIESVMYEQSAGGGGEGECGPEGGTIAHLHCVDPRAHGGKGGGVNKSGGGWGFDDSDPT